MVIKMRNLGVNVTEGAEEETVVKIMVDFDFAARAGGGSTHARSDQHFSVAGLLFPRLCGPDDACSI